MYPCAGIIVRLAALAAAVLFVVPASADDGAPPESGNNLTVVAQSTGEDNAGSPAAWQPPEGGFGAYLAALRGERYTGLVYRQMASALVAGDATALNALFTSYFQYRRSVDEAGAAAAPPDLVALETDVRSGLREAAATAGLAVPEPMLEPVIFEARAIAARIYDLPFGGDGAGVVHEAETGEGAAEHGEARRAESSGLLYDAGDFVSQGHLQFVFGGTGNERVGRLVAELMRIARADGLVADEESVRAFLNRLVEDGVVSEADRSEVFDAALRELAPPAEPAGDTVGALDHDAASAVMPAPEADAGAGGGVETDDGAGGGPPAASEPRSADAGADGRAALEPVEPERAPLPQPAPRSAPRPEAQGREVPQQSAGEGKSDTLWVLEAAFGATVPADREDLGAVGHALRRDVDVAGRIAFGALWPEAFGRAHAGLALVAIFGSTGLDELDTGPSSVGLSGSSDHIGLLPYLSIEMPVSDALSVRLGGGIGVAWRDVAGVSGGVRVVDAHGTAVAAQLGAGVRHRLVACMDVGFDLYATYLGAVKGRSGAVSTRFEGTWDLAAQVGLRVALNGRPDEDGCR